jgi:hypothetical protein
MVQLVQQSTVKVLLHVVEIIYMVARLHTLTEVVHEVKQERSARTDSRQSLDSNKRF